MQAHGPSLEELARRVARLERENRRLKLLGAALLVAAGAVLVMAQVPAPARAPARAVEASKFVLRDAKGKRRAELGLAANNTPNLILLNEGGETQVRLGTAPGELGFALFGGEQKAASLELDRDGPKLALYDARGAKRLNASVSATGPALGLLSSNGEARAAFGTLRDESAFLHVFGAREHGGVQLQAGADRAVVRVFDAADRPRAVVGMLEKESAPGIVLNDASGTTRAVFMASPQATTIELFDRERRSVWRAP